MVPLNKSVLFLTITSLISVGWGQCDGCNPNVSEYFSFEEFDDIYINDIRIECEEWVTNEDDCLQSEIQILQNFINNNIHLENHNPLDIGIQYWSNGHLIHLSFRDNWYEDEYLIIPENIGNLTNLTILDLGKNGSFELPNSIGDLENLQYLLLDDNRLNSLPDNIVNLSSLKLLELEDNNITFLPEGIGELSNLEFLILIDSQLTYLPDSFWSLTNLKFLDLRSNQLTQLPNNISNFVNLKYLNVRNNSLTTITDSFCPIYSSINYINISNNLLCPPFPTCLSDEEIGEQNSTDCESCSNCSPCSESYYYMENIPESCDSDENCFLSQDIQFLEDLLNNSQLGDNPPPFDLHPLELGFQSWSDNRLHTLFSVSQTKMLEMDIQPSFFSHTPQFYENLTYFELSGEIPPSILNLDENTFNFIGLGFNSLTGEIPTELGEFIKMDVIWLNHNELHGTVPESLENITGLGSLWLSNNQLTGEFPNIFWNNNDIDGIYLNNNNFEGSFNIDLDSILLDLGEFQYLTINLSNNNITEIDNSLCNIVNNIESIYVGGNNICNEIPICIEYDINYCFDEINQEIYLSEQECDLTISDNLIPLHFILHKPFPNPFNPKTSISFIIPQSDIVSIKIYDISGKLITTLINKQLPVGYHSIDWDGSNQSSGIYIVKIESGEYVETEKVVLVK